MGSEHAFHPHTFSLRPFSKKGGRGTPAHSIHRFRPPSLYRVKEKPQFQIQMFFNDILDILDIQDISFILVQINLSSSFGSFQLFNNTSNCFIFLFEKNINIEFYSNIYIGYFGSAVGLFSSNYAILMEVVNKKN